MALNKKRIKVRLKLILRRYSNQVKQIFSQVPERRREIPKSDIRSHKRILVEVGAPILLSFIMPSLAKASTSPVKDNAKDSITTTIGSDWISDAKISMNAEAVAMRFNSELNQMVEEYQKNFAETLENNFSNFIEDLNKAKQAKRKSKFLRENGAADPRFYCGLSLFLIKKTAEECGADEYADIINGIENPQYCPNIAQCLNGGKRPRDKKDIVSVINAKLSENPNACFVAVHRSKYNTSSGYHVVVVVGGKVYSLNNEHNGVPVNEYFRGEKNTGSIFAISDIAEDKLRDNEQKKFYEQYLQENPQDKEVMETAMNFYQDIKQGLFETGVYDKDEYLKAMANYEGRTVAFTNHRGERTLSNAFRLEKTNS